MTKTENGRNYGIDLLRITAMLMVVLLHVLGQGGILDASVGIGVKHELMWLLEISAYCAVNCYALISGYVGSKSKYSSLAVLWLQVLFYTVLITAGFAVFRPETVGLITAVKSVFPVMSGAYWYFSSYFCLFLFLPLLNNAVCNLSGKQLKITLIIMTVFFSCISLISGGDAVDLNTGYSAVWLAYLYLVGAYVKKYEPFTKLTPARSALGYIVCTLITWAFTVFSGALLRETALEVYSGVLVNYTSPTVLGMGFFLFMMFKQVNIRAAFLKETIKLLSPLSFSVYIIHSHPLIWEHILKGRLAFLINEPVFFLIIYTLGITAAIYLVCSLIDIPRHLLFSALKLKKRLSGLEDRLADKIK